MKIYVNKEPVDGPWGGGNHALKAIIARLHELGHDVVYKLCRDIDRLVCLDPRPNRHNEWCANILEYKNAHNVPLICRVGDVGTHGKPMLSTLWTTTIHNADAVIFVSEFARDYLANRFNSVARRLAMGELNACVVHNAPDATFYARRRPITRPPGDPVKIVTHHWSDNPMKGHVFYKQIDDIIQNDKKGRRFEFTFIGRKPANVSYANYIAPLDKEALARELSKHDVYISASRLEACPMHPIEGIACGLPVVYTNEGGGMVELCKRFGRSFEGWNVDSFFAALDDVVNAYEKYAHNVMGYTLTMNDVARRYADIILRCGN